MEQEPDCVNKVMPTRTRKEWNELHNDKVQSQCKDYYLNNTDNLKKKRMDNYKNTKQLVECQCGAKVLNCNLQKHQQTEKHKKRNV